MSTSASTPKHARSNRKGPSKGGGQKAENARIYALPLPLLLEPPPDTLATRLLAPLGLAQTRVIPTHCAGTLDGPSRSVWVTSPQDSLLLWRRGFYGKGALSRSEPTWLARQRAARAGPSAEQITAQRRAERKQFKLDRARAIAAVAAEAEVAFAEGRTPPTGAALGFAPDGARVIPSAATWKPSQSAPDTPVADEDDESEKAEGPPNNDFEDMDIEHLQLTLPEAFFLSWALDSLSISSPEQEKPLSLQQTWYAFQNAHIPNTCVSPSLSPSILPPSQPRFDNPFLLQYAAYHHYRSLGWVVRSGVKFCCDLLLYKRGPVFHHAEFAIVLCPVYEDPTDRDSSPFNLQNTAPFSWTWLSTINRVNSQVQKTLVLTYVTIPSSSRVSTSTLASPACLTHYSVREVVVRRFIPARMRD